jgi:hypothetical protein
LNKIKDDRDSIISKNKALLDDIRILNETLEKHKKDLIFHLKEYKKLDKDHKNIIKDHVKLKN